MDGMGVCQGGFWTLLCPRLLLLSPPTAFTCMPSTYVGAPATTSHSPYWCHTGSLNLSFTLSKWAWWEEIPTRPLPQLHVVLPGPQRSVRAGDWGPESQRASLV